MPWRAIFSTLLPVRACSSLTQVPISPSVYFKHSPKLWALQCGVNGPRLFSSHCCTHKHILQNFLWSSPDRQHQLRLPRSRSERWWHQEWVGHIPAEKLNKISVLISVTLNIFCSLLKLMPISFYSQMVCWWVWRMKMLGNVCLHMRCSSVNPSVAY